MAQDFNHLFKAHSAMVSRIAASYEADLHRRDDLVQDIALALWRSRDRIKQAEKPKAYIARIAQNTAISHVAKAVKLPKGEEPSELIADPKDLAEQGLSQQQEKLRLTSAVRALPLGLRSVVTMALEGLTHREIGDALGLTENNVGVRFNRAKAKLKEMLTEEQGASND